MRNLFLIALCFVSGCFGQTITTIAGGGTSLGDGGPAAQAQLNGPLSVRLDAAGNIYFVDALHFRVRKIDSNGIISTVAGNGTIGTLALSPAPAIQVSLANASDLAVAKDGTFYIAEMLLEIVANGTLTPTFNPAVAVTVDNSGTVYYGQQGAVYRFNSSSSGMLSLGTLVAGTLGQPGDSGDDGPALLALFHLSSGGLAADAAGNLYIADKSAGRIRKFMPGGNIQTVAGTGSRGFSGDGGPATQAQIAPDGVAVDAAGNIFIAEGDNNRVRKVDTFGNISTVYTDNTFTPNSVAVDASGNIYTTDLGRALLQKIVPATTSVKPSISKGGLISAAANVPGMTPGGWLAIYGQNLSSTTRQWRSSDFQGEALPAKLDNVSVSIDNKPAAVYFISPAQIDVQVPDDAAIGPGNVTVTNGNVTSAVATVNMAQFAPAFFTLAQNYVAALHADNSLVGKPSLAPGATPAKPGESIVVYGTGFGPTAPATPAGVIVNSAHPLANTGELAVTIGGLPAQVQFAGIVAAGLYQFNIVVPNVAAGDQPIEATIAQTATQTGMITVQR